MNLRVFKAVITTKRLENGFTYFDYNARLGGVWLAINHKIGYEEELMIKKLYRKNKNDNPQNYF